WVKCFHETGSCASKPRGGSTSPLEAHAPWLLTVIEKQPDLTLDEVVCAMHKHGIAGSRTAVWEFFKRHKISFKKKSAGGRAGSSRCGPGTSILEATARHAANDCLAAYRRGTGKLLRSWPAYAGME